MECTLREEGRCSREMMGEKCIQVLEKTRKVGAGFGDGGREGSQFRHK